MPAYPLGEPSHGLLINPLESIFHRETGADHSQHQMVTHVERVSSANHAVRAAVTAPVLRDRPEIGEGGREMLLLKVGFLLVAPHNEPFGVGEERVIFRAKVAGDASRLRTLPGCLGRGLEPGANGGALRRFPWPSHHRIANGAEPVQSLHAFG